MTLVKVTKNKAYFKRFQVKYRRRREGKTDYRARRTMIQQDKTKYGTPKYRFVVRITNRDIVCQVVHAKMTGDDVICAAYSHELPTHGITVGLTNYAAAYATGLLCARRALTQLGLAEKFPGVADTTGAFEPVRTRQSKPPGKGETVDQFPFKAILDVGIARTTTGARIFGAMKGAVDGGIAIPHKPNRFPGFDKEAGKLDVDVHRQHIFGQHVASYLQEVSESGKKGTLQFGAFIRAEIKPEDIESIYKKAHASIRENPNKGKAERKQRKKAGKRFSTPPLTLAERRAAAADRVKALRETLQSA